MNVKKHFLNNLLILFFFTLFLIQVIFLMPSPYGDSVWFLKLSFNICRDNLFLGTKTQGLSNEVVTPSLRAVEYRGYIED